MDFGAKAIATLQGLPITPRPELGLMVVEWNNEFYTWNGAQITPLVKWPPPLTTKVTRNP
jgi:hypothetical protein